MTDTKAVHWEVNPGTVHVYGQYGGAGFSFKFQYGDCEIIDDFGNRTYDLKLVQSELTMPRGTTEVLTNKNWFHNFCQQKDRSLIDGMDMGLHYYYRYTEHLIYVEGTYKADKWSQRFLGCKKVKILPEKERYERLAQIAYAAVKEEVDRRLGREAFINNLGTIEVTVKVN